MIKDSINLFCYIVHIPKFCYLLFDIYNLVCVYIYIIMMIIIINIKPYQPNKKRAGSYYLK